MTARRWVFRAAAADIREHGLSKVGFEDQGRRCTVGALVVAGGGNLNGEGLSLSIDAVLPEVELLAQLIGLTARVDAELDDPDFGQHLRNALLSAVYDWNDGAATAEQVADLFEKAADRLEAQQQAEADLFGGGLVVVVP